MPVIQLSLTHLGQYCKNKADQKKILDALPYLGLDIEDQEKDTVSVEYSPNRPDFSSEVGIARSLAGLLGVETGAPKYTFLPSKFKVSVEEDTVRNVRPAIQALYAEISVGDETIKQLIAMQEDLHNGVGRKRAKVAIGIHNAEVITNQIKYRGCTDREFSFVPLGGNVKKSIGEILEQSEQGIAYGKLLGNVFPILEDSKGNVLSMPPIINGDLTRLAPGQSKLFVDITGTEERSVDVSTAIIASMLSDSGGLVFTVQILKKEGASTTPDMTPRSMHLDLQLARDVTGYDLTKAEAEKYLAKSRIGMYSNGNAIIPRFRYDIIHPIDLVEEVALGMGVGSIKPQSLKTSLVGSFSPRVKKIDAMIEALVGLGLTEIWNLSLNGRADALKVDNSKSQSFEYLRSELTPSLLSVLGGSTHQEYPQKIFEIAPVFKASSGEKSGVKEEEHLSVSIAASGVNYSMIRSVLEAFLNLIMPKSWTISFKAHLDAKGTFGQGRTAEVIVSSAEIGQLDLGTVGEISLETLDKYGLKVPVAGFEIALESLLKD